MSSVTVARSVTVLRASRCATPARAARIPLGPCLAATLTAAYFARASLLAYSGTQWTIQLISQLSIAALVAASTYVVAGGVTRVRLRGLAMIAAGAASLWQCETVDFAAARWAGWALMLLAVGPVLATPTSHNFRRSMADTMSAAIIAVVLVSAAWKLAGLPKLGRGDFTGVMWHSMTLGPLAALAGLISLSRAMSGGAIVWYGSFAVSGLIAMLAASRSALAGLMFGALVLFALKLKRRPLLGLLVLCTGLTVAMAPTASLELVSRAVPESLASGLMRKNFEHTREAHWDARWEEFLYSPVTGVGFACGWEGAAGYNDETGAVETGSSYLSVLSMTGALGAAAFLGLVGSAALGVVRNWRLFTDRQKLEAIGLGGFWAVHLGAEGYIYGVGSVIGLAFWLWLGRLIDQTESLSPRGLR